MTKSLLKEFEDISPEEERHPRYLKTVGQILDLIQRLQDETDKGGLSTRIKNVGVEFAKVAMGEIPIVGGALGAADGLYAMYQAGKDDDAHSWAELEEYPILNRMDMHPTLARHLDPVTLRKVDKAYQEYLATLSRDTLIADIANIDEFTREWILDDTTGKLNIQLVKEVMLREFIRKSLLTEISKLPTEYFNKIDTAVKDSRFWEEPNAQDDIDEYDSPSGAVMGTPAAESLSRSLHQAMQDVDLDIDILVRSHDTDDLEGMSLHPDHPAWPNRWLIDARWYISKERPGRNTIDLEVMTSEDGDDIGDALDHLALVRHISQTIRHEIVHYTQMKKQAKNKGLDDTAAFEEMINDPRQVPPRDAEGFEDYLNSHIEIDAHAHDGAEELLAVYGYDGAMNVIRGNVDLDDPKLPNALSHYFEQLPPDSPTLKKLKSKMYAYIQHFDNRS